MNKILAAALACASITAHAEFWSGNDLLTKMQNPPGMETVQALGYVMGVFDATRGVDHCPPDNITAGQVRDMVRNHLEASPAVRHFTGDTQVRYVLGRAWPCPKKNNGGSGV